jgi:hypothetical protein
MIPAPLYYVCGNHDKSFTKTRRQGCEYIDGKVIEYKGYRIGGLDAAEAIILMHFFIPKHRWLRR